MSQLSQGIRPTQFITSYGPGAILEGVNGPRVICSFERSELFPNHRITDFEIVEPSLQQLLGGHARIFRLPTNADLQVEENRSIYSTDTFPRWSLCVRHGVLYQHKRETRKACPQCETHSSWQNAWSTSRSEAVSLVMACPKGHLDEVNWVDLVHQGSSCRPKSLKWNGSGSSLRNVTLSCPDCGKQANLGEEYMKRHRCSGRFVESGESEQCTTKARISQRGAANLHLTEILSAITVPRPNSPLIRALNHVSIVHVLTLLKGQNPEWPQQLVSSFLGGLPNDLAEIIRSASHEEIKAAADQVQMLNSELTAQEARRLEFEEIMASIARGGSGESEEFTVDASRSQVVQLGGLRLRVTPVTRLRVVSVQKGYRRLNGELVERSFSQGGNQWYVGVELFGEGLFLSLEDGQLPGSAAWDSLSQKTGELHHQAGFVWWHTLSHRLIRALSVYSGYGSASVRERVYWTSQNMGGLLLYAVQPGGDGTLGGLIALVERFQVVLDQAVLDVDLCSNDPFCEEAGHTTESGPACYACLLLSETSCEHRNRYLDRPLLAGSAGASLITE